MTTAMRGREGMDQAVACLGAALEVDRSQDLEGLQEARSLV